MRRYLIIAALLLLAGCPGGKGVAINWATQPHRDAVPPPAGAWAIAPTIRLNTNNVYSTGALACPGWIAPPAAACISAAVDEELAWATAQGVPRARTTGAANIEVYFYYDPALAKSGSALPAVKGVDLHDYLTQLLAHDMDVVAEDGKATSALPPKPKGVVAGQATLRTAGDTITRCYVWLNLSWYESARLAYIRVGKTDAQARALAATYMAAEYRRITWHECGHALFGLADDIRGTAPGQMVYRNMVTPFSANETDVIRWLYPIQK